MTKNRWMIFNKDISELKRACQVDERILTILANRDIDSPEKVDMFLEPSLDKLYDPFLMEDMDRAVDLVLDAIDENKHIHIVGDYDQDGNSAIVILMKGLGYLTDRITYSIPDRMEDGYGLNKRLVDQAAEIGTDLLMTCDNGIAAHEEVAYAKEKGLEVLVTDHHQVIMEDEHQVLPPADAILNPHRLDCSYPFKELCGAGVAFKLIQAIYQVLGIEDEEAYKLLEFACMGTICDVVDLVDENRIIAVNGLKRINKTDNLGVRYLAQEAGWDKEITAYAIGFVLGPCINASGRLSDARLGAELFLEEDEDLVQAYAQELVRLNNERKQLTEQAYEKAYQTITEAGVQNNDVIMAYIPDIHESIVGIVAGRIKDDFHRPTLIFTDSQDPGILKGSGRSIEAYNMFERVGDFKELTESFGGHQMAAGLSIKKENFSELERQLNVNSGLLDYDLQREVSIDLAQPIDSLDFHFIRSLDKLGPFGKANPGPKLADTRVRVLNYGLIGKNKNVLKMSLEKNGKVRDAIAFKGAQETYDYLLNRIGPIDSYNPNQAPNSYIDLVYKPDINEFRGERTIQLKIEDIRLAK